jgi:predicted metal-dependent enzyme (double-stranded beta helix superfamily)
MSDTAYDLTRYVEDLRRIRDEENDDRKIVQRVAPLAQKLAAVPGFIKDEHYACDEEQGFAFHLLHEEADHSNAVFLIAWLPHRGTPAHNHKTWGVVVGVEGEELETWWQRVDDGSTPGYADLKRQTEIRMGPGKISCVLPEDIHTVWNDTDKVSLSLHTYGKHINFTGRTEFDPEAKTEMQYVVRVA